MNVTDLKQEVALLIEQIDRTHRYSMSGIYELSDRVFGTNETPQSCASCLIRKTRQLRKWLEEQGAADVVPVVQAKKRVAKRIKNKE